ncbi:uncharacterized protein LOC141663852 [Apium graveolens]|uniref:uncharacterized protein LOC141663852 n=1 Tax=Apium graveolens TaxID=4045 RepID=UPI003D799F13
MTIYKAYPIRKLFAFEARNFTSFHSDFDFGPSPVSHFSNHKLSGVTSTNYKAPLSDISNKFIEDSNNHGEKEPSSISGCTTFNQEITVNHSKRLESTVKSSMSLRLFEGMDDGTDFDSAENFTIADFQAEEGELFWDDECHNDQVNDIILDKNLENSEKLDQPVPKGYLTLGPPTETCCKCGAVMWKEERSNKDVTKGLHVRLAGHLYQQYVVDVFSCIEQARLWWLRTHQTNLRSDLYKSIVNKAVSGTTDASNVGNGFVLPANFLGSRRYMQQNFQDVLAVCHAVGHHDIFLTMTTNPLWDEILQMMKIMSGCSARDSPDVIARVFHLKLEQLLDDIRKKKYFGTCIGVMYVVEFQKCGLPHVHMLIWLDSESKKKLSSNVDTFVSAEIPDPITDPVGYEAVKSLMIHGPCGLQNTQSSCMNNCRCTKHFPKKYCRETYSD